MPFVYQLGFGLILFAVLIMMNIEAGVMSPPFGINLFVAKGIAPAGVTMKDIWIGVLPFVSLHFLGVLLVMVIPGIATFLPGMMG